MNLYIGIDLGTSAAKLLLLMDELGEIKNVSSKEYPLEFPKPGWSQQNPEDWRKAILEGIPELLIGFDGRLGCTTEATIHTILTAGVAVADEQNL